MDNKQIRDLSTTDRQEKASLVRQMVKNLPAMQETQIHFLNWEDPLENGMATHPRILAWRTPWREKPGGLHSIRVAKSQTGLSN